jgi:hypothetical protein
MDMTILGTVVGSAVGTVTAQGGQKVEAGCNAVALGSHRRFLSK